MKFRFNVIGITKDRRTSEQKAQDVARKIEIEDAPKIALFEERVRANEARRKAAKKITATERFLVRRYAI